MEIGNSSVRDVLKTKIHDRKESKEIAAWMYRLNVIILLRQMREDMDLVTRADLFDVVSISSQLNQKNKESDTALHVAAASCNDSAVSNLLAWRADINSLNKNQVSPLGVAQGSCIHLLQRMASAHPNDAPPSSSNGDAPDYGWTALMVAAEIGDKEQIDSALLLGNNINVKNSRMQSALHIAASAGNADAVKILIEGKANLEDRDENQQTALCIAAKKGDAETVRNLVSAKADLTIVCAVDSAMRPETVLDMACGNECIELLKGYGVDGWTSLMVAVERGHFFVNKFLQTRESLICLHGGQPLPGHFQQDLRVYSNLSCHKETWKWGKHETNNLVVSKGGSEVCKVRNEPDYSCALVDQVFQTGVHRWTFKVKNVTSMWTGVARGLTEEQLSRFPGSYCSGEGCVVAFGAGSGDVRISCDRVPETAIISQLGYSSEQILDFELDTYASLLKFSVDGVLAVVVSNLDGRELQPYVCMDYSESIELLACASFILDERLLLTFDQAITGIDNSGYSLELDAELLQYSPKDPAAEIGQLSLQHTFGGDCFLFCLVSVFLCAVYVAHK
jgi:ankyrin repeat protein